MRCIRCYDNNSVIKKPIVENTTKKFIFLRSVFMIGMMISGKEESEIRYLIKREMDEILFDLKDERIELVVKRAMEERYKILFSLFKRVASPMECFRYMPSKQKQAKRG
jgi:hypothetical protein